MAFLAYINELCELFPSTFQASLVQGSVSTAYADALCEFAEIYYTYDMNDSVKITGGISFSMGDETCLY